ncbi:hypothetical protein NBH00_10280 [Paraconexibacter antarcticus]|uniref:VCBS repeat-containing protein n=1 Tax=Paraconexibacter antarcticus TaxID=2949664 RepID=A0ABY5DX23_9ACTN|nr:hypothetical protein [Paraconexibacter antarcticus]UTI66576.1 hypothetical protein NBH00_10280 [Paraconexibacter antarcticus]
MSAPGGRLRRTVTQVALGAAALAGALGLVAPAARAEVPAGSVTRTSGTVTATLSWQAGEFAGTSPRLAISRGGTLVDNFDLGTVCRGCELFPDGAEDRGSFSLLTVADLDSDHEPEVLFETLSGGAHCCQTTRIYRYLGNGGYSRPLSVPWGNAGYVLKDLGHDGRQELVGGDDAFAYAFSSYAASVFPPKIVRYAVGRNGLPAVKNVTRSYPAPVRTQAKALLKAIREARPSADGTYEIQGPIAAYVADEYLLGRGRVGRAELARVRARRLVAPGFGRSLLSFLHTHRYR